jgi:hypothetical protein
MSTETLEQLEQEVLDAGTQPSGANAVDDPTWEYAITYEEFDAEMDKDYPVIPLKLKPGPPWDDSIMHGIAGDITRKAAEHCEAHPAGLYLDLLVSLGSLMGRRPYFTINATRHYTNEYFVRLGESAKDRKGTGRDVIDELLKLVDPDWYQTRVMSGFGSAEAIINELRDDSEQLVRDRKAPDGFTCMQVPGVHDKRLMVREGELASIFQLAGKPESRADVVLRDGWDGKTLRNLVKGKQDGLSNSNECREPHLSISADTTRNELIDKLPKGAEANGFGNRFLYCYSPRVKMCPGGGPPLDWSREVERLQAAIAFARKTDCVSVEKAAAKVWHRMYMKIETAELSRLPGLTASMCARASAHVRRLALILCLLDGKREVETVHLHAAKRIWDYCQDSARYIFSGLTADQSALLGWITKKGAVTFKQLREDLYQRRKKVTWIAAQVDALVKAEKITVNGEIINSVKKGAQ